MTPAELVVLADVHRGVHTADDHSAPEQGTIGDLVAFARMKRM